MRIARPQTGAFVAGAVAACTLGVLQLASCGVWRVAEHGPAAVWSPDTLVMQPVLLRDPADSAAQRSLIGRPSQVRASGGLMFVTDATVDQIAVLDSLANVVRWIGARGRGPGELLGVGHLAIRDHHLFVAEALNGRVSEFTFDGQFVRSYVAPFAAGGIGVTQQIALTVSESATHYALLLAAQGEGSRALRRVSAARADNAGRWNALPGQDLLAADSSRLWVFDQGSGDVCVFAAPGAAANCAALPPDLILRLRIYRDRRVADLEAAMHVHVKAAPLAKDMIRVGCWLAIFLPLPDTPIVLLDVNDGTLTPVLPHSFPLPGWVRAASSFAWDGHGFVLVGDGGIGRLLVSRPPIHPLLH